MRTALFAMLFAATLTGCAAYLDGKVERCGALPTREELDACLGPVASHPDEVEAAFLSLRAAQVVLLASLTKTSDDIEVALREVTAAALKVTDLVRQARENP